MLSFVYFCYYYYNVSLLFFFCLIEISIAQLFSFCSVLYRRRKFIFFCMVALHLNHTESPGSRNNLLALITVHGVYWSPVRWFPRKIRRWCINCVIFCIFCNCSCFPCCLILSLILFCMFFCSFPFFFV